jgi:CelD/BcsL family acetyltransferase involved in cellulose biosynthesis
MSSSFVGSVEELESVVGAWDDLAVANGKPACSPALMLGWQRLVSPETDIVSVLVHESGALVGLAPLVLDRTSGRGDVRIMGAGLLQRIGLLARPGTEDALAAAVGEHIGAIRPRPDVIALEAISAMEGWPARLRRGLRPYRQSRVHWTSRAVAPVVTLEGQTFDSWLATRSSNFRSEMARCRRRLEQRGGRVRLVTGASEDLDEMVRVLGALHRGRWAPVGSGLIGPAIERLILDVAHAQPDGSRLRLWVVELDGEPIGAQLFFAAGGEVIYWNGGWNQAHADLKPGMMGILAATEDAIDRGERRLDLGGGAQPYKLRFADSNDPLEWAVVAPLQARYPRTWFELMRQQSRWRARGAFNQLPAPVRKRLKAAVGRS